MYLREQARPSLTAALIRFASETRDEKRLAVALEAIRAANDRDLTAKIQAEEWRTRLEGRSFPEALKNLTRQR